MTGLAFSKTRLAQGRPAYIHAVLRGYKVALFICFSSTLTGVVVVTVFAMAVIPCIIPFLFLGGANVHLRTLHHGIRIKRTGGRFVSEPC